MTTPRQLITGALRLINVVQVNENPTADDIDISLMALNGMLDSWSTDKLSIYVLKQYYFPLFPMQKEYTMGPGGDWDVPRPMNIEVATITYQGSILFNDTTNLWELQQYPNNQDIPIEILTMEQYAGVSVKDQPSTYPTKLYDNGNYPLRTITVWPVPTMHLPITLWLWQPLIDPQTLDDNMVFPKGYERALRFNLAIELAAEFGKELNEIHVKLAADAYANIKRHNSRVYIMRNDIALTKGQTIYNWNLATAIPN